jgi:hypothetical protein
VTLAPYLDTQAHEGDLHVVVDEDRLSPYYALNRVIRIDYDGWQSAGKPTATMEFDGSQWALAADYDDQPLRPPTDVASWTMETTPLFRLYFVRKDDLYDGDSADQSSRICGGTVTVRPRWPGMRHEDGMTVRGVPNLGHPYVDFQIQASNIDHERYVELLRSILSAWGVSPRYVDEPHEMSNWSDMARYVRVDRDRSGPIYATDGPIARMHGVLQGDQSGIRKHVEDHSKLPGYYVTAVVDDDRVRRVLDGHRLGKEVKHYYPQDPEAYEPGDALFHPKLEVAYQTSATERTVYWDRDDDLDTADAVRELDEAILNVLDWSDLPVRSDDDDGEDGPYVADEYFRPTSSERQLRLHDCPLPEIADEQEAAVMRLWGRANQSDQDVLETLLTDGGKRSRHELADASGWSYRTVRRVVQRCGDVLRESVDGLELASKHMAERLADRVHAAEQALHDSLEDAALTAANLAGDATRSAWSRVRQRYNVVVEDGDGPRPDLRVRWTPPDRSELIGMVRSIRMAVRDHFGTLRGVSISYERPGGGRVGAPLVDVDFTNSRVGTDSSSPSPAPTSGGGGDDVDGTDPWTLVYIQGRDPDDLGWTPPESAPTPPAWQ